MDFSIVICTHNRADALERTLLGVYGLSLPSSCKWELILVDNGSPDQTIGVCQKYENRLPLRYLREEQQGKGSALNAGIGAARSDLVLLTDDDVDVAPGWASAMVTAANTHEEADFFGGKVLSRWLGKPPAWFEENSDLLKLNPRLDLGEEPARFTRGDQPRFIRPNLAVRTKIFEDEFTFRDGVPDYGDEAHGGRVAPEEFDLQRRLLDAGHQGIYVPEALVHHRDPPWRMTERYVRHWLVETGRSRVEQGEVRRGRELFGAPSYLWKACFTNGLKYAMTRRFGSSRTWLAAECRMCLAWGSIQECRALSKLPKPKPPVVAKPGTIAKRPLKNRLAAWINRQLVRMGPATFIALRWPWPMRKPYMHRAITVQARGGTLGDELMCLPVIEEIKRRNPRCRVRFVTNRPEFFRVQPQVDDVAIEKPGRQVTKLVYDAVLPPPRPLMSLMAECVGIRKRFRRIPPLRTRPSERVTKLIGSLPRPLVVVQPLATGRTADKNWPIDHWKECVRALAVDFQVVEVGNEPVLPEEEIGGRFTSLCAGTTLHDLAYVISQADLFIGPSSGGMHLANAYDIPALILFGGYEAPSGYDYDNVHPLYSKVECAPCWSATCPHDLKCLHAIEPGAVVAQAFRILGKRQAVRAEAISALL